MEPVNFFNFDKGDSLFPFDLDVPLFEEDDLLFPIEEPKDVKARLKTVLEVIANKEFLDAINPAQTSISNSLEFASKNGDIESMKYLLRVFLDPTRGPFDTRRYKKGKEAEIAATIQKVSDLTKDVSLAPIKPKPQEVARVPSPLPIKESKPSFPMLEKCKVHLLKAALEVIANKEVLDAVNPHDNKITSVLEGMIKSGSSETMRAALRHFLHPSSRTFDESRYKKGKEAEIASIKQMLSFVYEATKYPEIPPSKPAEVANATPPKKARTS